MDVKVGILAAGVASLMESRRSARSEQSSSSSSSAAGWTGSGGGSLVDAAGVSTSIDSLAMVVLDDLCVDFAMNQNEGAKQDIEGQRKAWKNQ